MRIRIEEELCQGHGRCYDLVPALVTDDDRGYGTVIVAQVPPEHEAAARLGAAGCPERALLLDED